MANNCYVAKRSCGCTIAVVVDIPDLKQMAAIIKVMVEAGLLIEREQAEYVSVTPPNQCPHIKERQLSMLPLMDRSNGASKAELVTWQNEAEAEAPEETPDNSDGGYTDRAGDDALDEALEAAGDEELVSAEVPAVDPETGEVIEAVAV